MKMTLTDDATPEERKIAELKDKIADIADSDSKFQDDCYLLMWLKDVKFCPDKAEAKIRSSLKWRREMGTDDLAEEDFCPKISAEFATRYDGLSKEGCRVVTVLAGLTDFRGAYEKYGAEKFNTYWRQVIAKLELDVIELNRKRNADKARLTADSVQGYTVVVDTSNFSLRQMQNPRIITTLIQWVRETVNYYPGTNTIIYINVGHIFKMILKVILPILQTPSRKIEVYGSDPQVLENQVFSRIDPDQLLLAKDWVL